MDPALALPSDHGLAGIEVPGVALRELILLFLLALVARVLAHLGCVVFVCEFRWAVARRAQKGVSHGF